MNTKLIGLSIDPIADHEGWIKDIQEYNKLEGDFPFPLISDDRTIATQLGMLDPDERDATV
jgi:alkyl hydroperoxide reductase subunit AhpC